MRNVRNITVAVPTDIYRQTRRLAADYDTTVTDLVRYMLQVLPSALREARYPLRAPDFKLAAERAAEAGTPWPPPVQPDAALPLRAIPDPTRTIPPATQRPPSGPAARRSKYAPASRSLPRPF